MQRFKLIVFVVAVSLALSFSSAEEAAKHSTYYYQRASLFESLPHGNSDIIFLGDSITDGGEWVELFGDSRLKNRGISGDVTWGVLDRLSEVTAGKPTKIFLMIGVNDLARGKTVKEIVNNHKKIVDRIRLESTETELFLQSVLPVNEKYGMFKKHTDKTEQVVAINAALTEIAEKTQKTTYIDLFTPFANNEQRLDPKYSNDGLHLTGDGYLLWKSIISDYVK